MRRNLRGLERLKQKLKELRKKPFRSPEEEFIKKYNPNMTFADMPGFDFMIPKKPLPARPPYYLKIEVKKISEVGKEIGRVRFRLSNGIISQAGVSDFLVFVGKKYVYFGLTRQITDYVYSNIPKHVKTKSFKKLMTIYRGIDTLCKNGLLNMLPVEGASSLSHVLQYSYAEQVKI